MMWPKLRFEEFNSQWIIKEIKDISKISSGGTPNRKNSKYWDGEIPWITTSEVKFNEITIANEFITEIGLKESSAKLFPINTILIAMYGQGATRGKSAVLKLEATTNQACAAIIVNKNVNFQFVFQTLTHNYEELRNLSNEGSQKNLSLGLLGSFRLKIPPTFKEQIKIAGFFSLLDKKAEKQKEKIGKLEELKKGMMQKLFSRELRFRDKDGGEFPEWEALRFGDVVEKLIGGGTPSREIDEYYGGNIPWVTVKDLKTNKYIRDAEEYITDLGLNNSSSKIVDNGDLIIPTRMAVGRILIAKEDVAINQDLKGCKLKPGYDTEFIYYLYVSKSTAIERLGSGSTVSGINIDDLMGIRMEVPAIKEQEKIAEYLCSVDIKLEKEKDKLSLLVKQKKGFMQRMFL